MLYHITMAVSTGCIYGALIIGGIGTGLFVYAPFAIAQWLVPPEEIPLAVGFVSCAQVADVTISLAVANAVFLNLAEIFDHSYRSGRTQVRRSGGYLWD